MATQIYDPNTGLEVQTFEDLKTQVQNTFIQVFGDDIELSEGSGFDTLINTYTGGFLQLLQLAQGAINSRDITLATGQELDAFGDQVDTARDTDESDDDYRQRLLNNKSERAATIGALNENLGALEMVERVRVYDINTTKSNLELNKGEILCVVYPKFDPSGNSLLEPLDEKQKVAQAILKTRAAGIKSLSKQDNYIEIEDSNGFSVTEGFDIAKKQFFFIRAVLKATDNLNRIEITEKMMEEMKNYFSSLFERIGGDVSINDIGDAIGRFITKLSNKTISLCFSDSESDAGLSYQEQDYLASHDSYTVITSLDISYE